MGGIEGDVLRGDVESSGRIRRAIPKDDRDTWLGMHELLAVFRVKDRFSDAIAGSLGEWSKP